MIPALSLWRFIVFTLLLVSCSQEVWAQQSVTKKVCLTPFGMEWKTSEEAKTHLVTAAKRAAVGELFGEMIRSITEVRNFRLQRDDIEAISIGFLRVQGTPEFYQGSGFGEICIKLNAHILEEDIQRFRPRTVERKVCIADPRLSLGEVRQTAEQQARIQAVRDFEPKLQGVKDEVVLTLIHESKTESGGFVPETTTYCVKARGTVYPIELMAVSGGYTPKSTEPTSAKRRVAVSPKADEPIKGGENFSVTLKECKAIGPGQPEGYWGNRTGFLCMIEILSKNDSIVFIENTEMYDDNGLGHKRTHMCHLGKCIRDSKIDTMLEFSVIQDNPTIFGIKFWGSETEVYSFIKRIAKLEFSIRNSEGATEKIVFRDIEVEDQAYVGTTWEFIYDKNCNGKVDDSYDIQFLHDNTTKIVYKGRIYRDLKWRSRENGRKISMEDPRGTKEGEIIDNEGRKLKGTGIVHKDKRKFCWTANRR